MVSGKNFAIEDHNIPISVPQAIDLLSGQGKRDLPERVRTKCQDIVFKAILATAKKVGLEYISVTTHRIDHRGNEQVHTQLTGDGSEYKGWPAVWEVSRRLNINLCGNTNQTQIIFECVGRNHAGRWDTKTGQLLESIKEVEKHV